MTDDIPSLHVAGDRKGLALLTLAAAVLALSGLLGPLGHLLGRNMPPPLVILGTVWFLFFGLATVVLIRRLASAGSAVVEITTSGIRDRRIARELISWSAVRQLSTFSVGDERFVMLDVDPEIEQGLGLTAMTRMTRSGNRAIGAHGLPITLRGLKISFDDLWTACESRWKAAHQPRKGPWG